MKWDKLLSNQRLGMGNSEMIFPKRSPFQQDFDRIIFSSSFRKLQDKTQIFPLSESDYVRTRLTHSLETASVARSLGTGAGDYVCKKFNLPSIFPSDFGAITAAAALAHDIGNPPLGHAGEEAVQEWFKKSEIAADCKKLMSENEVNDIIRYEGNAQGFRILTKLQYPSNRGGMQLCCATLGAFIKYPCLSNSKNKPVGVSSKKYNVFSLEKELFKEVAETLELKKVDDYSYARHPLAFLVEAADDISYRIVDFEDGFIAGRIEYAELEELFSGIIKRDDLSARLSALGSKQEKVEFLRSRAIGRLVDEVINIFLENHDKILAGEMEYSLIDLIPSKDYLHQVYCKSAEVIYNTPRVSEVMVAGFELISDMLDIFIASCNDIAINGENASPRSRRLMYLLPDSRIYMQDENWRRSPYVRIMYILDYISSLTDSAAVKLHKKLKGISI